MDLTIVKEEKKTMDARFCFRTDTKQLAEIKRMADLYGMSIASYIRFKTLNYQAKIIMDADKLELLMKKNIELARLGNLLKIWLFNDPKYSLLIRAKIELKLSDILDEIEKCRLQISEITEGMFEDLKQNRY